MCIEHQFCLRTISVTVTDKKYESLQVLECPMLTTNPHHTRADFLSSELFLAVCTIKKVVAAQPGHDSRP